MFPVKITASSGMQQLCCLCKSLHHLECISGDAVIYTGNIPFQYNEREGRNTEFNGNPMGTVYVAAKIDHEFLLSQRSNSPNMSSHSINVKQLNVNEKCSNFTQVVPANTSDSLHYRYLAWK